MQKMAYIRKHYRVPAKRGGTIRIADKQGAITGTPKYGGWYINILVDGNRQTVHPFSVDYLNDAGEWVRGDDLKAKYDAAWDRWNAIPVTRE